MLSPTLAAPLLHHNRYGFPDHEPASRRCSLVDTGNISVDLVQRFENSVLLENSAVLHSLHGLTEMCNSAVAAAGVLN